MEKKPILLTGQNTQAKTQLCNLLSSFQKPMEVVVRDYEHADNLPANMNASLVIINAVPGVEHLKACYDALLEKMPRAQFVFTSQRIVVGPVMFMHFKLS